jgi:hypothetical protein
VGKGLGLLSFLLLNFSTSSAHEDFSFLLRGTSTLGRLDLNFTWHVESIIGHLFELLDGVLSGFVLSKQAGLEFIDFRILCFKEVVLLG